MYAIIESGGKQHQVEEGDEILVELLNANEGDKVEFAEVLLVNDGKSIQIGAPHVAGYIVSGTLLGIAKDAKVKSIRRRVRRQNNRTARYGHRQKKHLVKIEKIGKQRATKKKEDE